VLYELCAQKKPFESGTQTGLVSKILKAEYNPLPTFFSKELAGIVALCLTKDYKKRPSISELLSNKGTIFILYLYKIFDSTKFIFYT